MNVLLISTYELGHQPLAVARPAAYLAAAGHGVRCLDLSVEPLDEAEVREAAFVGISVPMHTATRLGLRLAERVRALNPTCHVCFYGLYASLHADVLLGRWADSVVGGEFETPLAALVERVAAGLEEPRLVAAGTVSDADRSTTVPGVMAPTRDGGVFLGRQAWLLPRRDLLPTLDHYARAVGAGEERLVGYVEASRGCAHHCRHCPIPPVYEGRLRIVEADVVIDDVRQLVAQGARHITFGDPDFFNGIRHSLRLVEALHAEFPDVTFDATIKIEHVLEHRGHLAALRAAGCLFVVSAVESVHDHILAHLQKGHTAADVVTALELMGDAGIPLRPTFVPFTPWTTLQDYLELLEFVARHGLVRHVDPVQYAIRLLVPRGSCLIGTPSMDPYLGPFDETLFAHRWAHPDPRVDALQRAVNVVVEDGMRDAEDAATVFARIHGLASAALGRPTAPLNVAGLTALPPVPRLTEPWFC